MNNLTIYFLGVVFNAICVAVILYKKGKITATDLAIGFSMTFISLVGTIVFIVCLVVFILHYGDNIIIWKRKEKGGRRMNMCYECKWFSYDVMGNPVCTGEEENRKTSPYVAACVENFERK